MNTDFDQFRTLFLDRAPEGAYSEEFKNYVETVWPGDEQVPTLGTMMLITKFLLVDPEPHLSEQAGDLLTALVNVAVNNKLIEAFGMDTEITPEMIDGVMSSELAQHGMVLGDDGEIHLITVH